MRQHESVERRRLFGPLPTHGVWTSLGLTRGQFLSILAISVALFVLIDGPVWRHVHDRHFGRIVLSYGFIVPAVAATLYRNGYLRLGPVCGASVVIALVKLVLTAGLLVTLALAGWR